MDHKHYGQIHIKKGENYFKINSTLCSDFAGTIDKLYNNIENITFQQAENFLKDYADIAEGGISEVDEKASFCFCNDASKKIEEIRKQCQDKVQKTSEFNEKLEMLLSQLQQEEADKIRALIATVTSLVFS